MSAIFISHSSADNEQVQGLKERLETWNHHSVFLDFDPEVGIQAGRSWERTLYRKLRACRAVVAWVTDTYLASYWCFAEIALARMEGKPIFAILDPGLSANATLPSILTEKQFMDLRQGEEQAYLRLKNGLKELDILGTSGDWDPKEAPYLGLSYYDEKHAPVFFGREDEIRAGMELINRGAPNLIMILGASGSGKSSLTRAGILPRLRMESEHYLLVEPFRPRQDPFRELAEVLDRAQRRLASATVPNASNEEELRRLLLNWSPGNSPREDPTESSHPETQTEEQLRAILGKIEQLKEDLPRSPETNPFFLNWTVDDLRRITADSEVQIGDPNPTPILEVAVNLERASERRNARIILVIDQFEELLGYEAEGPDHPANRFLNLLRTTLDAENCPVLVLGTMRSDFLGTFQRNPALRGIDFESLSVGPMKLEGMRKVIDEPAKLGAIELENGLADRLLADTETPDALPLLSFTLWVLWRDYRNDGKLTIREYDELGGLEGAIAREADALLRSAENEGKAEDLRKAFVSMARLSEQGEYARHPVNWNADELTVVHNVLERFVERRLLVKLVEGDDTVVEVAHESLFRSWAPLKTWLDENRADFLLRQQINRDAKLWQEQNQPSETLWWGARLLQAKSLLTRQRLTSEEHAFVDAGLRRRRRGIGMLTTAILTTIIALSAFLAYTLDQKTKSNHLLAHSYLKQGIGELEDGKIARGLAMLLRAREVDDATLNSSSLALIDGWRGRLGAPLVHSDLVSCLDLSGSGETAIAGCGDGFGYVWDLPTQSVICRLEDPGTEFTAVAINDAGTLAITLTFESTAQLWELPSGQPIGDPIPFETEMDMMSMSGNGSYAIFGDGNHVIVWDLKLQKQIGSLVHGGPFSMMEISQNGKVVVTQSDDVIRVWTVATASLVGEHPLTGKLDNFSQNTLAMSDDGSVILSTNGTNVQVLRGETGKRTTTLEGPGEAIHPVTLSGDGKTAMIASRNGEFVFREVDTGHALHPPVSLPGEIWGLTMSRNGSTATVQTTNATFIYDVATGREIDRLPGEAYISVWLSDDGEHALLGGNYAPRLWSRKASTTWATTSLAHLAQPITQLHPRALSNHGTFGIGSFLAASEDEPDPPGAQVFQVQSGKAIGPKLLVKGQSETAMAIDSTGQSAVVAYTDLVVRTWNPESGALISSAIGHTDPVISIHLASDGQSAITGSLDQTARIWNNLTGELRCPPLSHDSPVAAVALSEDGKVAITGSSTVKTWDVSTGRLLHEFTEHQEAANLVALNRDGTVAASSGWDPSLRIWNTQTGAPIGEPIIPDGIRFWGLALDPGGKRALTVGAYGKSIQVWDTQTCLPIGKPSLLNPIVRATVFGKFDPISLVSLEDSTQPAATHWTQQTHSPKELAILRTTIEIQTGLYWQNNQLRRLTYDQWNKRKQILESN